MYNEVSAEMCVLLMIERRTRVTLDSRVRLHAQKYCIKEKDIYFRYDCNTDLQCSGPAGRILLFSEGIFRRADRKDAGGGGGAALSLFEV